MAAPDVTIDFRRQFSLPVGVPPALQAADLQTYCAELGLSPGWLEYAYLDADLPGTTAALTDLDPGLPSDRRVSLLNLAGGAKAIVVPRSFDVRGLAAGAITRDIALTRAQVTSIGLPVWTPVVQAGAEPLPQTNAARFRWDDANSAASVLPHPFHSDESLALGMDPPAAGAAIGADQSGIFDDDNATILLTTTSAARDGELDPLLLRAPALGLARFDRYRHVEATVAAGAVTAVSVRAQSAAGAMMLHVLPDALTPPADALAPILKEHTFVFEHLAVDDVAECLAPLVWLQLLRFDELTAIAKFRDEVRRQCAWALRTWLAHETLGLGATGSAGLAAPVTAPFRKPAVPTIAEVKAAIAAVKASAAAKAGLHDFVEQSYAPVLAGKSWVELGANFPVLPANRQAADAWAHAALEAVMMDAHVFLVAHAGCPLGRPSTVYPFAALFSTAELLRRGISTFDLEALALAGRAAEVFPAVAAPAAPALRTGVVDLTAYAGEAEGYLAALRLVAAKRTRDFTTRDCLRESVTGWNRTIRIMSTLEFDSFAAAGHPLAPALLWAEYDAARTARGSMNTLNSTVLGGKSLSRRNVEFWIGAANFASGVDWPVSQPGLPDVDLPAGPTRPYMPGVTAAATSGFDEFDIDAALVAMNFLRDGADTTQKVTLPLILALLDREGFRADSLWQRAGALSGVFRDNLNNKTDADLSAASRAKAGFADGFARVIWTLNSFGLDIMDTPAVAALGGVAAVGDWKLFARQRVAEFLQRLLDAGVAVDLDVARMKEYTLARTIGRVAPATKMLQAKLASRQLQWIGIVLQHGEFQRRHALVRQGPAAGPLDSSWLPSAGGTTLTAVPEYTAARPAVGADAEAASRYAYLAYYSLLYLAFNGSPGLWNSWVAAANANRGALTASQYFLYKITDAQAAGGGRILWHRGHVMRFITALDAYLRIDGPDAAAIVRPNPPWDT